MSRPDVRMGKCEMKITDITALPHALAPFVFAFTFLALLGSEIICNLPKLGKESFLVCERIGSVDMSLLAMANLEYICHV